MKRNPETAGLRPHLINTWFDREIRNRYFKHPQPMLAEAYSFTFMFPGLRVVGAIAGIIILGVWLVCLLIRRR